MLISHRHRFIYFKTPKSAGSSVEMYFEPACLPPDTKVTSKTDTRESRHGIVGFRGRVSEQATRPLWYNHQTAAEVQSLLLPETWSGYLKFANIRNPFARSVSQFLFRRRVNKAATEDFDRTFADFGEFLDADLTLPYARQLSVGGENVLNDAIRFETLETDVTRLSQRLGYTAPEPLSHMKGADDPMRTRPIADFFSPGRTALILKREAWCFDHYGYDRSPIAAGRVGDHVRPRVSA